MGAVACMWTDKSMDVLINVSFPRLLSPSRLIRALNLQAQYLF